MNIFKIILILCGLAAFIACEEDIDPNPDLSNTAAAYVELTSSSYSQTVDSLATEVTLMPAVQIRTALGSSTEVQYEYSGDASGSGTAEIPAGTLSAPFPITISGAAVDAGMIEITLTGANNNLSLGRANVGNDLSATTATASWTK